MTSWTRGRENEEGEEKMHYGNAGEKVEGAAQTAAGETEQGVDNLGDTMSGKQHDLQGHERDRSKEASEWMEHRGDDAEDMADRAGDWMERRGDEADRNM